MFENDLDYCERYSVVRVYSVESQTKTIDMANSYMPVEWVYREVIDEQIAAKTRGKVFFFNDKGEVDEVEGVVMRMDETDDGLFIVMDPESRVRVDRIITLFGKPGAAYDEYDAYANQCLSCTGGYDL